MDVNVTSFPATRIAVLRHRSSLDLVSTTAARFIAWCKTSGPSSVIISDTWGIAWDDPQTTPQKVFRFDICSAVVGPVGENAFGMINGEIPGGRCAVIRHRGPLDTLTNSVWFLYRDQLLTSNETLRDFPVYLRYLNFVHEVVEHELQTDIYLPLVQLNVTESSADLTACDSGCEIGYYRGQSCCPSGRYPD